MHDLIEVIARDIIDSESSTEAQAKVAFYQTILKPEVMDKTAMAVLEEMEKSAEVAEDNRSFAESHPGATLVGLAAAGLGAGYGGYKGGKRLITSLGERRMGKLRSEGDYLGGQLKRNIEQADKVEKKLKDRPDNAALTEFLDENKKDNEVLRAGVKLNLSKQRANEKLTNRLKTPVGIATGVLGADIATGAVGMAATRKKQEG